MSVSVCHKEGVLLGLLLLLQLVCVMADNLGTLRTYQRAACDQEVVRLWCPQGTSIAVQVAQYGNAATTPCGERHNASAACLWPTALQYSLLQTVVERCQKKRHCKFQTAPTTFGGDPCPGYPKYVEVAYKCRPYEFRSKVACQGEVVQLQCNPNSRLAVYSASYGRTEYESIQCPQPQGVLEETCLASYATETVMHFCHGKRRCTIVAADETFGNPCEQHGSQSYLKVVYTCVPRKVLKEGYEESQHADEQSDGADSIDEYDDPPAFSPAPKMAAAPTSSPLPRQPTTKPHVGSSDLNKVLTSRHSPPHKGDLAITKEMQGDDVLLGPNCTVTIYTSEKRQVIGFITEWISAYTFLSNNKEKFYLYLIVSIAGGLLLFLGLVIGRLLVQRHRNRAQQQPAQPVQTVTSAFTDDISEDMDLTTVPLPTVHSPPSEVVRYGSPTDVPRSLNRSGNSQYYYG